MIYLDNAASTKPTDKVLETLEDTLKYYGNPSSLHLEGQMAKCVIMTAEGKIRYKINASENDQLIFTSGATMSNNVFIQGWLRRNPNGLLVVSAIEHNDILMLADYLEKHGTDVIRLNVDEHGLVDLNALNVAAKLAYRGNRSFLCSIQAANGECGTIQDVRSISRMVHMYGGIFHSDMTQYLPYFALDVSEGYIDAFSMSGQKIGAIKGTGMLYIKDGIEIDPVIFGEQGLVGGTENVLGIACLGTAFEELDYDNKSLITGQMELIRGLAPYGKLMGSAHRIPNNVYWAFDNYDFESMVVLLDGFGIEVSAGSACSSGKPSHVVTAMGFSEKVAKSCIRFSLSKDTSEEDIQTTIEKVKELLTL